MQFARVVVERGDAGWVATPTGGAGLEPDLDGRSRERPGDGAAGHRDRAGRFRGAGHGVPPRRGLTVSASDQAGADGVTRIVEVGAKPETERSRDRRVLVTTTADAVGHLVAGTKKGDPIADARRSPG